MLNQYNTALKEMANYLEENYKEETLDTSSEDISLEEFLNDMQKENDLFDSDVTGMVSN